MDIRMARGLACAAALTMALGVAGCKGSTVGADPGGGGASGGPTAGGGPGQGDGRAVSPLDNPDGTEPGLAPITSAADRSKAQAVIKKVATNGRGPKTGYSRDQFGY